MRITVSELASTVNKECEEFRYFWAAGIIKETLEVWKTAGNMNLLNETARIMARTYLEA